jgi:Protein of unknown function (DUF992)
LKAKRRKLELSDPLTSACNPCFYHGYRRNHVLKATPHSKHIAPRNRPQLKWSWMMKKLIFAALVSLMAFVPTAHAGGIKVGTLTCHIDGGVGFIIGSSKDASCTFRPAGGGRAEQYSGTIGKLGVDIGVTGETVLGWVVFAPGQLKRGSLRGQYTGASAEATIGLGVGANVLVGGFKRGINLQPLSLQAQTGLNVAAGIGSLTLN